GNNAGYDGGVIHVDGGIVRLVGGTASSNSASQRGGVIFSTGESEVAWTAGESSHNTAASGGALYISNSQANFSDVVFDGDSAPSGGVVFLAAADVRATNVTVVAPGSLGAGFAVHADFESVFRAYGCGFRGWERSAPCVVSEGEVVLDSCDFSESGSKVLVSASREVTVRNAIMGDKNYAYVGYNSSARFAVDAHTCASLPNASACLGEGEYCLDAANGMGVLCPSYVAAATGETVSLVGTSGSSADYAVRLSVRSPSDSEKSASTSESDSESESHSESASNSESGTVEVDTAYYPDLVVQ
ncbi:unnamed protein product, partial [Laminaria digitata]